MSSERAEQKSIRRINLGEGDENADWIKYARRGRSRARELLIHAELGVQYADEAGRSDEAYRTEVARRTLQLDLIDQIEGTELLIEHYRLDDAHEVPRLRRRLHALNRQMIAVCDPDEVRFFSLRPVPPEFANEDEAGDQA
jgi:hypothetical protein